MAAFSSYFILSWKNYKICENKNLVSYSHEVKQVERKTQLKDRSGPPLKITPAAQHKR
jgi:hypothetical protein